MRKILLIAPILFLLFLANAEKSFACSCAENTAPLEKQIMSAFKDSTAIFSGEVIAIKRDPKSDFTQMVKFKTEKSWKGKFYKELVIRTASGGTACGYPFEIGKKYLVYGYGKSNDLRTNICSPTALLKDNEDIAILNKLKKKR